MSQSGKPDTAKQARAIATRVNGWAFKLADYKGAQFTTPGTGLSQAPPSGGATNGLAGLFGNPTYGTTFSTFSPLRLFVPVGSNITEGFFFIHFSLSGLWTTNVSPSSLNRASNLLLTRNAGVPKQLYSSTPGSRRINFLIISR